jgi:8-oxo-dGTP pyrophosphatase MutT (NUDIX family)
MTVLPDGGARVWAEAASSGVLTLDALVNGHPFCAGVLLVRDGALLCTLGREGLPGSSGTGSSPGPFGWRIGGVGGGQEPGEDIRQCAHREAREEVGRDVDLVASPVTYLHDIDTNQLTVVRCTDGPAPFCVQRQRNADPTTPFRPDLPAGPYTYYGLFLARVTQGADFVPGDDAEVLLWMPLARWRMMAEAPATLHDVLDAGARVVTTRELDLSAMLWLPPDESLVVVAPLLAAHPELGAGL